MSIGTAKPTSDEMEGVTHHFVDFISIKEPYTAGMFENDCLAKLDELFESNNCAVLVGGSGMYVNAVCNGLDDIPSDMEIRQQLIQQYEEEGIKGLQEELRLKDPQHFNRMDVDNPQRLMRALEVCRITNKPYSEFRNEHVKERPFNIIKIGLEADRAIIYDRINRRVDAMMKKGLLKEVEGLLPYNDLNALNTVGYKEFWPYFKNEQNLEESVENLKMNTRRFSKRQMTWFRKDKDIKWFDINNLESIIPFIEESLND